MQSHFFIVTYIAALDEWLPLPNTFATELAAQSFLRGKRGKFSIIQRL
jgi:hypothetical protein